MHVDARKLKAGVTLEVDVCIVGAGPAGLTLARELAGGGQEILVLESGGDGYERRAQDLNDGEVVGGEYAGLRQTRHRQVGGSPNIWNTPVRGAAGAKYVPLDPWDFAGRVDQPLTAWPFDRSHLEPYYRRAQKVCGLGPFEYGAGTWTTGDRPGLDLMPGLEAGVYQFGLGRLFTRTYVEEIGRYAGVRLIRRATVIGLEVAASGERIESAKFSDASGRTFSVRSAVFVLAAGAIENPRILLLSGNGFRSPGLKEKGIGNQYGWVGRCFMEHPRDFSVSLNPYSPRLFSEATFFDPHMAPDGTVVGGRIGLSRHAVLDGNLPNASVTFLPRIRDRSTLVEWATRFWLCPHASGRRGFRGGYGWSRMKHPSRWLAGFRLVVNLEQSPNPENRVMLSGRNDRLGLPRATLYWQWRVGEQAGLERLREYLAIRLERSGLGRIFTVEGSRPDPNGCHHAGTTRMSEDPKMGVVDPQGRVHGLENLFVTGGSVFPSAGYANPTLTIVALAIRLADHLRPPRPSVGISR